ncbi:MAG: c-type cytochrome [Proteobacteria bacterium]|nr:c-type cytochrome [Pseudomonadota bacterium]
MAGPAGNKAFAATLLAGLVVMVAGLTVELLVRPAMPLKPDAAVARPASAAASPGLLSLIAHADVAQGQMLAGQQCGACHSFTPEGGAVVGPDLYGVVGARVAGASDYPYSVALRKVGGRWTYERLDRWLLDPQAVAPGTLMSYPGMAGIRSRADVIAYLRTLADHPAPLPASTAKP